MEIYRDASTAQAAYHHCTINPATGMSRQDLMLAAHRMRLELDPDSSRPYVIVIHRKRRAKPGGADEHAHLVCSSCDDKGKALDDSFIVVRSERLARELEFDLNDGAKPLLGRHHSAVLRALKASRPEVAAWIQENLGTQPEKPRSSTSPKARSRAKAQGFDLPKAKAFVESCWQKSRCELSTFLNLLAEAHFQIRPGERDQVWIVEYKDKHFVGSVDRILRMKHGFFENALVTAGANLAWSQDHTPPTSIPDAKDNQVTTLRSSSTFRLDRRRRLVLLIAIILKAAAHKANWQSPENDTVPQSPGPVRTDIWGIVQLAKPRL
jgi:hypothetical protein